jgi:hypothetical protein
MPKLEEQLNQQTLQGTVSVNDQNLLQDLIQTVVLDDLNDVNISSPTDGQALGYQASTNSWQNVTVALLNDSVTNAKLANMATATVKGRATAGTGDPEDLAIDNDLSTVSASDDTIPSAKAVKAYVDILELKTRIRNGGLINGFIRVTVASNNLTVAISTSPSSQVDPTASNPVYVWIGDTLRSITSALSVTSIAGFSYFNAGSAELATREIDYFVYLGYGTVSNRVFIGYSRLPYGRLQSDFNTSVLQNERFLDRNEVANDTDSVVNVGRFAATNSGTASFNWSVPTFSNANLIQEPVYETRWLNWTPTVSGSGSMTLSVGTVDYARYKIVDNNVFISLQLNNYTTGGSASNFIRASLPITQTSITGNWRHGATYFVNNGANTVGQFGFGTSGLIEFGKSDVSNLALGTGYYAGVNANYEI